MELVPSSVSSLTSIPSKKIILMDYNLPPFVQHCYCLSHIPLSLSKKKEGDKKRKNSTQGGCYMLQAK